MVTAPVPAYKGTRPSIARIDELEQAQVLVMIEREELALAAGDRDAMHAARDVVIDQFAHARLVELVIGGERRCHRRYHTVEFLEIQWHSCRTLKKSAARKFVATGDNGHAQTQSTPIRRPSWTT